VSDRAARRLAWALAIELETLAGELCVAVDETIRPAHVSLWLRRAR
jgi:hypothetical protein